jgi:hypothetical protein
MSKGVIHLPIYCLVANYMIDVIVREANNIICEGLMLRLRLIMTNPQINCDRVLLIYNIL